MKRVPFLNAYVCRYHLESINAAVHVEFLNDFGVQQLFFPKQKTQKARFRVV